MKLKLQFKLMEKLEDIDLIYDCDDKETFIEKILIMTILKNIF